MDLISAYMNSLTKQNVLFKDFTKNKPICLSDIFNRFYVCTELCQNCEYNFRIRYNNLVDSIGTFIKDCFNNEICPLNFFYEADTSFKSTKCAICPIRKKIIDYLLNQKRSKCVE